jgi:hypothetical protein
LSGPGAGAAFPYVRRCGLRSHYPVSEPPGEPGFCLGLLLSQPAFLTTLDDREAAILDRRWHAGWTRPASDEWDVCE